MVLHDGFKHILMAHNNSLF